jgi:hypothetical protein
MADKYHSDTQEKIETITYSPALQDSGDLEVSTRSITATSKPAIADYSANLTTPDVPDARVIVRRLCQRFNIHIDSFGGTPSATKLCYSLEVNGVERATGELTGAGADNPVSWDITEGQFNLGSANTVGVFLWVDQGNAVLSLAQLWQGIGTCTTGWSSFPLEIAYTGLVQVSANFTRVGSGSPGCHLMPLGPSASMSESLQADISSKLSIVSGSFTIRLKGSVATDLNYVSIFNAGLRSLQ